MNVTNNYLNILLKNPLAKWLHWSVKVCWQMFIYRKKHLVIKNHAYIKNCTFGNYNTFYEYTNIINTHLGNFVYIANQSIICNTSIGSFCSIGPDCKIGLGMHPTNHISTFPAFFSTAKQCQIFFCEKDQYEEYKKINIGNDVWIGANVTIIDGINIGDGAIIAAGAVVTKDVEPYTIVGGVPAHFIKRRFSKENIEVFLNFKWWNKDIEWIKENANLFNNPTLFLKKLINEQS
jgi:acetyltransferase-like isoleucine patch superfamily enzyme